YSALTAMAIDPVFISPAAVPEVQALGGEDLLDRQDRHDLARVRQSKGIEYGAVRRLKDRALRAGFGYFLHEEWDKNTPRARQLRLFAGRERGWLDEYALFRALHAKRGGRDWRTWEAPLRDHSPAALQAARRELEPEILYYTYLQWLAAEQWEQARDDMDAGI